ncbi:MAG TPA: glutamate-5-semialdehyde dehydrogenase [Candidatus Faecivivens stercoripullorum]|uniref:Gamma-glutamyl phosphate reductase n=1 Tax=Candidatus Faecivivens stercoripullorum TaxID=2840805 RepID=A0A9D1H4E0_9FIRM|nr:glutamate-5-semialdehyde dehydrogenase [Candidatus Faecivivens stercoripullorum]
MTCWTDSRSAPVFTHPKINIIRKNPRITADFINQHTLEITTHKGETAMTTQQILQAAKSAAPSLLTLTTDQKNAALLSMADALERNVSSILSENEKDMKAAEGSISTVMLDRLRLTPERVKGMADGIREVASLPDPVRVLERVERPNGMVIEKTAVPMGVIAIIYESRPNVTSDAAALAIKAGSACVLRGGKEAFRSGYAIVSALREGLRASGLPETVVSLVEDTTRESSYELMRAVGLVDLLIPRGGAGLIRACVEQAKVPCIQTGTGICHIYVDDSADLDRAVDIVENAKASRPSVCNAEEVLLVHSAVAEKFLPALKTRLVDERAAAGLVPVELRLDERAAAIIPGTPAGENDFDTEFLDYILAVKVVDSVDEAIAHISAHSTGHSEAILTGNKDHADRFTTLVDSAAVYVNCSTRFTDGGEFGLGCEMGISTQKLHARGPMGLGELMTYKYVIRGNGQIR